MKLFRERLPLLSNMANVPMKVNGKEFTCVEAAFQSFKAVLAGEDVDRFVGINGFEAKRLGKTVNLKGTGTLDIWESVKVDIMEQLLYIKVQDHRVKAMLMSATDDELVENNNWGDTFWGVVERNNCLVGQNMLGKLWQSVKQKVIADDVSLTD